MARRAHDRPDPGRARPRTLLADDPPEAPDSLWVAGFTEPPAHGAGSDHSRRRGGTKERVRASGAERPGGEGPSRPWAAHDAEESIRDPVAEELVTLAIEHAPHLNDPSFTAELVAWSRAEAACVLIGRWLDEHELLDGDGEPRSASNQLARFEKLAAEV